MTDTEVEQVLISRFEEKMASFLTATIKKGKTIYTDVCYENKAFSRPDSGYWFELFFISAEPTQVELGSNGRNRWHGIFQVNICVPKDIGKTSLNARFNAIASAFPRGYITNGIRITSTGRTTARSEDDYCFLPVSIYWEADLSK